MSLRKKRSDSVLHRLPQAVQDEIVRRMVDEGEGVEDIRDWLKEQHGVKTSAGAVSNFWYSDCIRKKLTTARSTAEGLVEDLLAGRPDFDKATLGMLSQRAFDLASMPGVDAGALAKLIGALNDAHRVDLKREDLAISKAKLKLLQDKAALADKAKGELENTKLSPEEKMARFKAIFGVK